MFQLSGKVVTIDRLPNGYSVMRLRRDDAGLLGPEIKLVVPSLVMVRDGLPEDGAWVEVGAQSFAETGHSRISPDIYLVARYIWAASARSASDTDDGADGEAESIGSG